MGFNTAFYVEQPETQRYLEGKMSDFIEKLEILNKNKDTIIEKVRQISTAGVSKTQAQNLREYSAQTQSIDEILLYLDYQCSRDRNLKPAGEKIAGLIKTHKDKGIDVIRYLLGTFARWVIIESKRGE
jgi:hypothetical protein